MRIFALADYAAVSPGDQKLYISGANVQQQFLPAFPGTVPQLYLVVLLAIPWNMASEPYQLRIRMLDGDRRPIGPDPLLEGQVETGRPPGTVAGQELTVPIPLSLAGLRIEREGIVYFHVEVADRELGVQPFRFRQAQLLVPGTTPPGPAEA